MMMKRKKKEQQLVKNKKWKLKKKVVVGVSIATACAVTGGVFYIHGKSVSVQAGEESKVQSASAKTGDIENTISGSGTLASADGNAVEIPSGLTVKSVAVESGDTVSKGDTLATVDHSSVLSAMDDVQDKIDTLDTEIASIADGDETQSVTASVAGTVTAVNIAAGSKASTVMGSSGALLTIAVNGDTSNTINVTATDGTVASVSVAAGDTVAEGDTLFTLSVDTASSKYKELISERQELATTLQQLAKISETDTITADQDGTIGDVDISASGSTSSGSGTSGSSTSGSTSSTGSTAKGTTTSLSTSDQSSRTSSSAVAKTAACTTAYTGQVTYTAAVLSDEAVSSASGSSSSENSSTASSQTDTMLSMKVSDIEGTGLLTLDMPTAGSLVKDFNDDNITGTGFTGKIVWDTTETKFGYDTQYSAKVTLTAETGYSFSTSSISGSNVYKVKDPEVSDDGKTITFTVTMGEKTEAKDSSSSSQSGNTSGSGSTGSSTSGNSTSGNSTSGNSTSGTSGMVSSAAAGSTGSSTAGSSTSGSGSTGSSTSGSGSSGSSTTGSSSASSGTTASTSSSSDTSSSTSSDSADSSVETAFTYIADDKMMMTVSVDEQDINSVSVGQAAQVTLDAIEDKTFTGKVTKVSSSASSSGNGSAKYSVEIEIDKDDQMKIGMSASATIVVDSADDVVTIPVNALQEKGSETYVYTSVDSDGTLSGETEVKTGLSDGDTVEITSGLSDGDTVYYQKTGNTSSSGSGSGSGMPDMQSGQMPGGGNSSGTMPSGDNASGGGAPSGNAPGGQTSGGTQSSK